MDIHYLSLLDISGRIHRREITSLRVTEALLDRIVQHDLRLNSVLMLLADRAIDRARQADAEIANGLWRGPLHGVPVGIKDLHWTKNLPTTGGMEILRDFRPGEDATVVRRLESAGAVIIAKLNMTEGALLDHHAAFPRPSNPWSAEHWTGVSSSGSGVATAAGFCFAATGTDTGGSIRMPSAANSLSGIKPTWGRVSRHGLIHLAESLDHIGPMARSVADAAAMLQAMAGPDPLDPTALDAPVPDYLGACGKDISDLTIGIDWDYATGGLEEEIAEALRRAAQTFAALGARVIEVKAPWTEGDVAAASALFGAEALAAHRDTWPAKADGYGPRTRARFESYPHLDAASVALGYQARDRLKGKVQSAFRDMDLILLPGLGKLLPTWDEVDAMFDNLDEARKVLLRFNSPFNLTGLPTISLPAGFSTAGLPIGMQLVGPALGEPMLIRAGDAFQRVTDYHTRHPALD
ncbi:MAG: amidase [Novosphingobium sp.]|nr:amidase [Novosphingobium sp.]